MDELGSTEKVWDGWISKGRDSAEWTDMKGQRMCGMDGLGREQRNCGVDGSGRTEKVWSEWIGKDREIV